MFTEDTVLVLGAGASWHYGYPTGEDLVKQAIEMAKHIREYLQIRKSNVYQSEAVPNFIGTNQTSPADIGYFIHCYDLKISQLSDLIRRLEAVKPLVIDYFLAWNNDLSELGKFIIAAVILDCESSLKEKRGNQNRRRLLENDPFLERISQARGLDLTKFKDQWYRFLIHKIVYDCHKSSDILKNKLKIITFNYDTSLEAELYHALSSMDFITDEDAKAFLTENRIIHMYGGIRPQESALEVNESAIFSFPKDKSTLQQTFNFIHTPEQLRSLKHYLATIKLTLDAALDYSKNIRTIEFKEKDGNGDESQKAKEWIKNAEYLYILGYGFDQKNNERLSLNNLVNIPLGERNGLRINRKIRFTNYGDIGSIVRRTAPLFNQFHETMMSTKSTYEALEQDFDAFDW